MRPWDPEDEFAGGRWQVAGPLQTCADWPSAQPREGGWASF